MIVVASEADRGPICGTARRVSDRLERDQSCLFAGSALGIRLCRQFVEAGEHCGPRSRGRTRAG